MRSIKGDGEKVGEDGEKVGEKVGERVGRRWGRGWGEGVERYSYIGMLGILVLIIP